MMTDYKIPVQGEENGIIYQIVRYYEGDITTENEYNVTTDKIEPVTRYRRTNMYEEIRYEYAAN